MCGIIGIIGNRTSKASVVPRLLESLKRLEYRGYDSAGLAILVDGHLDRRRAKGKILALEALLEQKPFPSDAHIGIGHTRWATHGVPSERNAHPQVYGRVAVVHNGIIENFASLKSELVAKGHKFTSDTDTEVIAQLIDQELKTHPPLQAFQRVLSRLEGAYALAILIDGEDSLMLGARRGSPLVVGYGVGEMFLGSDALAVGPFTQKITYLEEGDSVLLSDTTAYIFDAKGEAVQRAVHQIGASAALVEKESYRHFMEKEIHEQPKACQHTLSAYLDPVAGKARAPSHETLAPLDFADISRIQIVACGSAFYSGLVAKYLFESLADLPLDVEIASEFRYRKPALIANTLCLAISQSGETADTLAALRWCKSKGFTTAALVNSHESSLAREADLMWPTHAGPEIGVASTKAFTAQVSALTALAIAAAAARGHLDAQAEARQVGLLMEAPGLISSSMEVEAAVKALAPDIAKARDVLYLGRGIAYPIALEGALKLKEISYIHAEAYAAGELKHGPIALVDEATPVILIAPSDDLFEKAMANLQEVQARGAKVILITDGQGAAKISENIGDNLKVLQVPKCDPMLSPLALVSTIQLLAYHVAVQKGTDVDQPRNLAKSVTVE